MWRVPELVGSAAVSRGRPQLVLRHVYPHTDRKCNNGMRMRTHARHDADERGRRSPVRPSPLTGLLLIEIIGRTAIGPSSAARGQPGCQYDHQSVPAAGSVDRSLTAARRRRRINSADNSITWRARGQSPPPRRALLALTGWPHSFTGRPSILSALTTVTHQSLPHVNSTRRRGGHDTTSLSPPPLAGGHKAVKRRLLQSSEEHRTVCRTAHMPQSLWHR